MTLLAPSDRAQAAPPLAAAAIVRGLGEGTGAVAEPVSVEVVAITGSTNEDLLERARRHQPETALLRAADEQTAGRGRQRRSWLARPRSALLFSLGVPLKAWPSSSAVTLACGVALADSLIERGIDVTLKWPNDILFDGRKLGGVLCELGGDADGNPTLVVGVGINGWLSADDRARIGQPAAALEDTADPALPPGAREAWIAALGGALLRAVRRYETAGFALSRERFNELLHGRDAPVDIVDDGRVIASGRQAGVDADGRLVLQTTAGRIAIGVGDVSLRAAGGTA